MLKRPRLECIAMPNRLRGERLQIMLSPEEVTALDDFRFKKRMAQPSVGGARIAQARACRRGIYDRRVRLQIERIWRRRQDAATAPMIGD